MNPDDLLEIAESLASGSRSGRPRQAELRRSISTAYYALFHMLANNCADLLVGIRSADQTNRAWRQVYRALDHGLAKRQCTRQTLQEFPQGIIDFANQFVKMQESRHLADYDPFEHFSRSQVSHLIEQTKTAIAELRDVDRRDLRAFAAFVLFPARRN